MDIGSVGGVVTVFNRRPPVAVPDRRNGLKNVFRLQQLFWNIFLECRRVAVSHIHVDDPVSFLHRKAANPFSLLTHNCRLRPIR
jgi:hypothetical protein